MLSNKLCECYRNMLNEEKTNEEGQTNKISFTKLMASKGIRYFGLITWPIIVCSTLLTLLLTILHYDTKTSTSLALFLIAITLECFILSFVKNLCSIVGGTCAGYALVAPAFDTKTVQILSQQEAYACGQRCTAMLNGLHRFMSCNHIENFGCDYSSSGITMNFINAKLKTFFAKRTLDGLRYDTYVFFYSGPTRDTGDIALSDNQAVTVNLLLQWWCENGYHEPTCTSRLILIFDTYNSHKWLKLINCQSSFSSCKPGVYLVLQTYRRYSKQETKLIELGQIHLGQFTDLWLKLNSVEDTTADEKLTWKANYMQPKCAFSYYWSEYSFQKPTNSDIELYLNEHYYLKRLHLFYLCLTYIPSIITYPFLYVFKCLKRTKFMLLTPKIIDTYHGFRLFVR
ncbi:unnamed protein product [Didymodactylos carnosus]|uniref:Transmembrane protein 168 n=1 Tax=Didymodactylos carnosus TaxID=1234261 RepID=A0A813XXW8_9BILA|nr:unnamed protein product [Didymodactylos carnosus]CAF0873601.1 unnamed protein product [Didymodactylos carnosus]CAF3502081.1 unnamed protein product [Didymodactylos carnosus]CAF3660807.1 unnamed protein product [Didymodactylos carnosus]